MHILHILDHSLPLHSGYAFRTRAIIACQRARGWETSHLTSTKHYPYEGPTEEVDGLLFYRTKARHGALDRVPIVNQYTVVADLEHRLRQVVETVRPDVMHAHSPCLNGLAALRVRTRTGIPLVYEMRASWEDAAVHHGTTTSGSLRYRASRRLETYVLQHADAVTTICEGLREDVLSRGIAPGNVTVIPNAVDVEQFTEGAQDSSALCGRLNLAGKTVLGFAGSFYEYEGLALLLTALTRIRAVSPDVRLLLVGGGPEEERLKSRVQELGLGDAVIFTGRVPHAEVRAYYDLVDVFVYPRVRSRLTDTVTPLKPLEAMAQRRLVVASDVGGHRELIRHGDNGILFAADDDDALAEAVLGLIHDRGSWAAMQDAGRRYVEDERTWSNSVARYEDAYASVLS